MEHKRWEKISEVFAAVSDADPTERDRLLVRLCAGDQQMREEVDSLIRASGNDDTLLDTPGAGLLGRIMEVGDGYVGRKLGSYRLTRFIASGGMGSVYLGERADEQFHRTVAIKLIRHGLIDERSLERFRNERQTLAGLDHPYIGHLLDGGVTEAGLPYLVMEYVDGKPIDEYCDLHQLTIPERLRLFLKVCEAVQYAHGNLIVHRDLKPGNILITASGNPKLLDFGIAKALEPDKEAHPAVTHTQQRLLTPEYASPEQIRGEPITTATDVYSLGVVLYEMLTGNRPYRVRSRVLHEIERAVCEDEPQRPSTAVRYPLSGEPRGQAASGSDVDKPPRGVQNAPKQEEISRDTLSGGSSGRLHSDEKRWRRRLRGDLDAIVLMALRKQPDQRYASVEQFANDIRNHLSDLPITARQITPIGRSWKSIWRHRFAVAAVVLIFLSLVGGIVGIAGARARERAAAKRARQDAENARVEVVKSQQVIRFLKNVLAAGSPQNMGRNVTLREVLDLSSQRVEEEFGEDPEAETAIRTTIGETYAALGEYDVAEPHFREALALQERIHHGDHPDVARSLRNLGILLYQKRDYEEAESKARAALEMSRRLYGPVHADVAQDLNNLAAVLRARGEFNDAERLFREALAQRRTLTGDQELEIAETLNNLANLLRQKGDISGAEAMCREALALRQRRLAADHPLVTQSMFNLAVLLASQQEHDEAIPILRESIKLARQRLGPDHPNLVHALNTLGSIHFMRGDFAEAEAPLRECVRIRQISFDENDEATHYSQTVLGRCLARLGKYEEAEEILLEVYRKSEASDEEANAATFTDIRFRAAIALKTLYELWERPQEAARYEAIARQIKPTTD